MFDFEVQQGLHSRESEGCGENTPFIKGTQNLTLQDPGQKQSFARSFGSDLENLPGGRRQMKLTLET